MSKKKSKHNFRTRDSDNQELVNFVDEHLS